MNTTGWTCPKCTRAFAPHVNECAWCNASVARPVAPFVPGPQIMPWFPTYPDPTPIPCTPPTRTTDGTADAPFVFNPWTTLIRSEVSH